MSGTTGMKMDTFWFLRPRFLSSFYSADDSDFDFHRVIALKTPSMTPSLLKLVPTATQVQAQTWAKGCARRRARCYHSINTDLQYTFLFLVAYFWYCICSWEHHQNTIFNVVFKQILSVRLSLQAVIRVVSHILVPVVDTKNRYNLHHLGYSGLSSPQVGFIWCAFFVFSKFLCSW